MTKVMEKPRKVCLLVITSLMTIAVACTGKGRTVTVGGGGNLAITQWTEDQQEQAHPRCESRAVNYEDQSVNIDPVKACDCVIEAAAKQWNYNTYFAKEDDYLDELTKDGTMARCQQEAIVTDGSAFNTNWSAPLGIMNFKEDGGFDPSSVSIATNADATFVTAAFLQKFPNIPKTSVYAKTYDSSRGWSPLTYIDANVSPDQIAKAPEVFYLDNTRVMVLWTKENLTQRSIWYNVYDGKNWMTAGPVSTNVSQIPEFFSAATDGKGQAIVTWSVQNGANRDIWVRRYGANQWFAEEQLSTTAALHQQPIVTYSANSEIHLYWTEYNSTANTSRVNYRHYNGAAWDPQQTIYAALSGQVHSLKTVFSNNNRTALAWLTQVTPTQVDLQAAIKEATGAWPAMPSVVDTQLGLDAFGGARQDEFALAFEGKSSVLLTWRKQSSTGSDIYFSAYSMSSWTPVAKVSEIFTNNIYRPMLVGLSSGAVQLNFLQRVSAQESHVIATAYSGGQWLKFGRLDTQTANLILYDLSQGTNGRTVSIWGQDVNDPAMQQCFFSTTR